MNLFSSFDASLSFLYMNWSVVLIMHLFFLSDYWILGNLNSKMIYSMVSNLYNQFDLNFSNLRNPGHCFWLIGCFIFIAVNNFLGILPYIFTASSHLVFSMTLALVSWTSYYLMSLIFSFTKFMSHLVPLGTPVLLLPLMVLIELVSGLIRPITLSVRLVANIIAGHLLLTLLSSPLSGLGWGVGLIGLVGLVILLFLESAVAIIQGYVFSLLSSLYLAESNSSNF